MAYQGRSKLYSNIAETGFTIPSLYDKYRPSYPDEAVEYLISSLQIPKGACILEIGAGTGKLTEQLSSHTYNFRIIAMEPHDDMRAFLCEKHLQNVIVMDGLAETIPLMSEAVDCVLVAQAFHWFANVTSLREIHRVLIPNGGFGMIWNVEDYNSPRSLRLQTVWEAELRELIWNLDDGQPRFKSETWQAAFKDSVAESFFRLPLEMETSRLSQVVDVAELENRIFTYCMLQNASADEREIHRRRIRHILQEAREAKRGILHMQTSVIAAWTHKA